jgi:hypothetical protein
MGISRSWDTSKKSVKSGAGRGGSWDRSWESLVSDLGACEAALSGEPTGENISATVGLDLVDFEVLAKRGKELDTLLSVEPERWRRSKNVSSGGAGVLTAWVMTDWYSVSMD